MSTVLGVDGCPGGWVGALVRVRARAAVTFVGWLHLPDARAVLAVEAASVGIDMPIGLPDVGPRRCDLAARARLPGHGSAVFPAPVRAVLDAGDYAEGRERSVAASGRSLSAQTWNLVAKIRDLDAVLGAADDDRVVEVHPEVSFAALAGRPLPAKKSAAGQAARLDALAPWVDAAAALRTGPPRLRTDDALDALAAAWSAARWLAGRADVLPPGPTERDSRGRPMRIVV